MEHLKFIKLLDNTTNQLSKFKIRNWIKINDGRRGMYGVNDHIKRKSRILKSGLYHYSDTYIVAKGTITN